MWSNWAGSIGEPKAQGVRIVVGACTGLGVDLLSWQDGDYAIHPPEGGHMDFVPTEDTQNELFEVGCGKWTPTFC